MVVFICLFFPAMISISRINKNRDLDLKQYLENYCMYNIFVNLITFVFAYFLRRNEVLIVDNNLFTISFTLKYLIIASIFAYIFPSLEKYAYKLQELLTKIKEYLKLNIEIEISRTKRGNNAKK